MKTVNAVEHAITVITALKELNGAGVTELAENLNMSKSGVHKQLSTLVNSGFVTKDNHKYRLGFQFLQMGEYVKNNSQLYKTGAEEVDGLAEKSGYFAYLVSATHEQAYCIYTAEGANAVVPNLNVGMQVPLHSTAAGKAILANLAEDHRKKLLGQALPSRTNSTLTESETLEAELATIREDGVAFEDEENVTGMRGVGAPILSDKSNIVGAVAVSGPLSLLAEEHFEEEIPSLIRQTKNFIEVKISLDSRDPLREGSHLPEDFY